MAGPHRSRSKGESLWGEKILIYVKGVDETCPKIVREFLNVFVPAKISRQTRNYFSQMKTQIFIFPIS